VLLVWPASLRQLTTALADLAPIEFMGHDSAFNRNRRGETGRLAHRDGVTGDAVTGMSDESLNRATAWTDAKTLIPERNDFHRHGQLDQHLDTELPCGRRIRAGRRTFLSDCSGMNSLARWTVASQPAIRWTNVGQTLDKRWTNRRELKSNVNRRNHSYCNLPRVFLGNVSDWI
jgi:hypothetical protein